MQEEKNPLGIIGIDHLEFVADNLSTPTKSLFQNFGLKKTGVSQDKSSELFTSHKIRFTLNTSKDENSIARRYFNAHGEGVSKMSFLVKNAEHALETAVKRGANETTNLQTIEGSKGKIRKASIQGFGDVINEFIEREDPSDFSDSYNVIENDPDQRPIPNPFTHIDHLTNNVPKGEMEHWVEFYQRVYGFEVTRYFDIKGEETGLQSKVVQLYNGAVIIPINEPKDNKDQIQEFLDLHKGPGVQHIAMYAPDIVTSISELHQRGIKFLDIPHTYYEDLPKRGISISENMAELEKLKILVDGDEKGYLLQLFTDTYIGPSFFEFIQRRKHNGFGEGNFQALFEAIERDQRQRGKL